MALALLVGLVVLAALVGVGAWGVARVLNRRRQQAEAEGRTTRGWGGRDRERVRTKYFDKERRARAQRARHRPSRGGTRAAPPEAEVPGPVNLDRLHSETLGLTGEADPDAVRQAYKARVREYHPDQVARLGIKLRVLAEEETKRINEAYAYFRKRYGF